MLDRRILYLVFVLALMATGCSKQNVLDEQNAVYYWRTELKLDSTERAFLKEQEIEKVYCRYFDVVMDEAMQVPRPNATIVFTDTLPKGVVMVPTVYITEDCMHQPYDSLAAHVVTRIKQMNETNHLDSISELQIDCDFTERSRGTFYAFLEDVRRELGSSSVRLSATIRLHQLAMPAPPVDYGVLMLYNTGDPKRVTARNPILDQQDVQPYVHYLPDYKLPLSAAYPVYRWVRQIFGVRMEHTVEASEILAVKEMVEKKRPDLSRSIITYHLDQENINRYDNETFKAIYHH